MGEAPEPQTAAGSGGFPVGLWVAQEPDCGHLILRSCSLRGRAPYPDSCSGDEGLASLCDTPTPSLSWREWEGGVTASREGSWVAGWGVAASLS